MTNHKGCLSFLAGGLIVGFMVFIYDAFQSRYDTKYLSKNEAIVMGLEDSQAKCEDAKYSPPFDCAHLRLVSIYEADDGWTMAFESSDKRHQSGAWIGRRGEYDSVG